MSRILVIGMGVPATLDAPRHAGPGLRSAHLATAIARAGHEVVLLSVLDRGAALLRSDAGSPAARTGEPPSPSRIAFWFADEDRILSPALRDRIGSFAPDAVVGVTAYAAALAARLQAGVPLWADVFGDLMAEAQAKAARSGSDWSLVHFWTLMRRVLEAGDRFSAVSVAQSHALAGQLGLSGRLSSRTAGQDLVFTIPCAAEATRRGDREAGRRRLALGPADFALLVSGGVNTWCDVETLVKGVALAMHDDPRVHLVVTGGAIPGHDEASHAALLAALRSLDTARVHVLGWIPSVELPEIYAACDAGLHVERDLLERRLGAENRVIEWLAHGLPCVTTAQSESGRELVAAGLAFACTPADPADLAATLARLASSSGRVNLEEAGARGRRWCEAERNFDATAAPLVEWCALPRHAADAKGVRLLKLGLLSHPQTSAEMLEAYVAELPVREIARRGVRWLARRAWSAIARIARLPRRSRPPGRAEVGDPAAPS